MASLVEPKPLSGFLDVLPDDALAFETAVERVKGVFRRYGYAPIDTPCIYRYETLTGGQAGIDKQLFEWKKREVARDGTVSEGEHVALRFDLTVPLARYVAANQGKLVFPFKRYDVGKVWRGERPQKGRYREFYQCDFDFVGTTAWTADLEVALVMHDALDAIGAGEFQLRLNDRQILNGLLASLGVGGESAEILRVVDKLDKIGEDAVKDELARPAAGEQPGLGIGDAAARKIIEFIGHSRSERPLGELFAALERDFAGNALAQEGVARLRFVVEGARKLRAPERFKVDLSIARGLGYYTGTVYETVLTAAPEFGSVCSGGRYDDLASHYTKTRLPGVGASVGISRLLAALEKAGSAAKSPGLCPVLVAVSPDVDPLAGVRVADELRRAGVGAEVYPQAASAAPGSPAAKLGKQLKYADDKRARFAIIVAPDELARGAVGVKDLVAGSQQELAIGELAARIKAALGLATPTEITS